MQLGRRREGRKGEKREGKKKRGNSAKSNSREEKNFHLLLSSDVDLRREAREHRFPLVFKSTPPFLISSPFHFFSSSLVLQLDLRDFFFFTSSIGANHCRGVIRTSSCHRRLVQWVCATHRIGDTRFGVIFADDESVASVRYVA